MAEKDIRVGVLSRSMYSTRRRYLRGIGGGSALLVGGAGCLGRGSPNGDDNGTRPSGTGGPGITVVSVDGTDDSPVVPSVEIVREAATESSPPRLRTTLENTGDEPVTVGEGRAVHLEYVTDDSGALVFLPSDGEFPAEPGCWRLTDGVAVTEEYRTFRSTPARRAADRSTSTRLPARTPASRSGSTGSKPPSRSASRARKRARLTGGA